MIQEYFIAGARFAVDDSHTRTKKTLKKRIEENVKSNNGSQTFKRGKQNGNNEDEEV